MTSSTTSNTSLALLFQHLIFEMKGGVWTGFESANFYLACISVYSVFKLFSVSFILNAGSRKKQQT